MARCAGSPTVATAASTVDVEEKLEGGAPTPRSAAEGRGYADVRAAGIVVTEMNTPMSVLDRASVSETTPTTPASAATMNENQFGVLIRLETGRTPGA